MGMGAHRRAASRGGSVAGFAVIAALLIPGAAQAAMTFHKYTAAAGGRYPDAIALADINRDGRLDAVTANQGTNGTTADTVSVRGGNGDGSIRGAANYTVGDRPNDVAVGDLDGDGVPDVVAANRESGTVSVLIGISTGGFKAAKNLATAAGAATGNKPVAVVIVDLNRDGRRDILVANNATSARPNGDIAWLRNQGAGAFAGPVSTSISLTKPADLVVADFNSDGNQDVAVTNGGATTVTGLKGNGQGGFALGAVMQLGTGATPSGIAVGDMNNDARTDLAVRVPSGVATLRGLGTVSFAAPRTFATTATGGRAIAMADLDRDGRRDVAVSGSTSNVSLLRGVGDGTLTPELTISTGQALGLAIGDLNNDGANDLAVLDSPHDTIDSFRSTVGETVAPQTTIDSGPTGLTTGTSPNFAFHGTDDTTVPGFKYQCSLDQGTITWGPCTSPSRYTPVDGTYTFRVRAIDGAGNVDATPAERTFTLNHVTFGAPATFAAGARVNAVASADLDNDGDRDLVTAGGEDAAPALAILANTGTGSFAAPRLIPLPAIPTDVEVGDVDGDGTLDLVAPAVLTSEVLVLHGDGSGTFAPPQHVATGGQRARAVALADLDGDGDLDIATANEGTNDASVLRNAGGGTFVAPVRYPTGTFPNQIAAGDVNNDGHPDLAVTNPAGTGSDPGTVALLLGTGDGSFTTPPPFGAGNHPRGIALADLDGDGFDDIITGTSDNVVVRRSNGTGGVLPATGYAIGFSPFAVTAADLDADGAIDVASASNNSAVGVFLGNGTGVLGPVTHFGSGIAPSDIVTADLNGDPFPDVVRTNQAAGTVTVLLGKG